MNSGYSGGIIHFGDKQWGKEEILAKLSMYCELE
jgi:hypothetical protein